MEVKGEGNLIWKIEGYDGVIHTINIKQAIYIPQAPSCLLSPQQWAQQANENEPKHEGTWCDTKYRYCTLYCRQERFCRTTPWDPAVNIVIIRSATSSKSYRVFVAAYEQKQQLEEK